MFFEIAQTTSRHNIVQRVRSSFAQGRDVILRQMTLRTFSTVSAAMVIRRLHGHPLHMREVIDWCVRLTGTTLFRFHAAGSAMGARIFSRICLEFGTILCTPLGRFCTSRGRILRVIAPITFAKAFRTWWTFLGILSKSLRALFLARFDNTCMIVLGVLRSPFDDFRSCSLWMAHTVACILGSGQLFCMCCLSGREVFVGHEIPSNQGSGYDLALLWVSTKDLRAVIGCYQVGKV